MRSGKFGFLGSFDAAAAWTPADITTALWLDAADAGTLTIDVASGVEVWADKSGNARDFSQSVSSRRPTLEAEGLNGGPCLFFDVSKYLERTGWSSSSSHSLFAVVSPPASGDRRYLLCSGIKETTAEPDSQLLLFAMRNNAQRVGYFDGTAWRGAAAATGSPQALGWVIGPSGGAIYRDGSAIEEGLGYSLNTIRPDKRTSIGARVGDVSNWSQSRVSEIVLLDGVISETDRQNISAYFAAKWGTPTPS